MRKWKAIKIVVGLLLASLSGVADAQDKPMRILIGFAAGGAPDAVARLYAEQLRKETGATAVVENRVGAAGKIALDTLLSAPADGTTLALMPSGILSLTTQIVRSFKFDVMNEFVPLASLAEYGFAFAAGPSAPNGSLSDFLAWAKAHRDKVTFGTPGHGTAQQFLVIGLSKAAGAELVDVPYRGGAPALNDALGGQISGLVSTEPLLVSHHGAGKLRALMVTSPQRNPKMPDVPTARESGFPQLQTVEWFGLFARKGTPDATLQRLTRQAQRVIRSPEFRAAIVKMGYSAPDPADTQLTQRMDQEIKTWATRIKEANFAVLD